MEEAESTLRRGADMLDVGYYNKSRLEEHKLEIEKMLSTINTPLDGHLTMREPNASSTPAPTDSVPNSGTSLLPPRR